MIIKNQSKKNAIILCGHGSRNQSYLEDFLVLKNKISQKLKSFNVHHCFIEINKPSIRSCLNKLTKNYEKIFFFPLLIFEGKHMVNDIRKEIKKLPSIHLKKIFLIDKISLLNEVLPIVRKIIKKKNPKKFDLLITSCSISKKIRVKKELEIYTKKLSKLLSIKGNIFHFVGDEDDVLKKIKASKIKTEKKLLHPIFFFNGYLYKKNVRTISQTVDTFNLKPISHYSEIIDLLSEKLVNSIRILD